MIHVLGGGTFNHVRSHMALAAPAFGGTARTLAGLFRDRYTQGVQLHLTKMADHNSNIITNSDAAELIKQLVGDPKTRAIIQNFALCDFDGVIGDVPSGKYAKRLKTREGEQTMRLTPSDKLIGSIREAREDIFVVGFKTTADASEADQITAGENLLHSNRINLVVANDIVSRRNILITEHGHQEAPRESLLEILAKSVWDAVR